MWCWPQISAKSQRRRPSFRSENLGIKSYMVSCISAIAMATASGSSAVSLSSPTQVRCISVYCYIKNVWSVIVVFFFYHCDHKSELFAYVTLKAVHSTLMKQTEMGGGGVISFLHHPPWAFVPPRMWYSLHAVATAVQKPNSTCVFVYRPGEIPLRQSTHITDLLNIFQFCRF